MELYAPSLLLFEVANSIWKNPNIPRKTARSLVRLAVKISPTLLNPSEEVAEQTLLLARKTRLTFYDAVYLTLAKSLSFTLVTADQEQLFATNKYTQATYLSRIAYRKL